MGLGLGFSSILSLPISFLQKWSTNSNQLIISKMGCELSFLLRCWGERGARLGADTPSCCCRVCVKISALLIPTREGWELEYQLAPPLITSFQLLMPVRGGNSEEAAERRILTRSASYCLIHSPCCGWVWKITSPLNPNDPRSWGNWRANSKLHCFVQSQWC